VTTLALPLRPVATDIASTLRTTVGQRALTQEIAADAARRDVDTVFFVGMGGSWASSVPATLGLTGAATGLAVYNVNAAEFVLTHLGRVNARSLVVASSHSGGTPETVVAAQAAAKAGALVVSIARDDTNPLAEAARHALVYGSEKTATSAKYELLEELSCSLFEVAGADVDVALVRAGLDAIPDATVAAVEATEEQTRAAVAKIYDADNVFVLGTGRLLGLAYMLSVCYLVEMQRQKSTHFNSADFFHGPFEMVDDVSTPVIHLAGEDETRPISERVNTFLGRYGHDHYVLDSAALALPGVPDEARGKVAHIAMASVASRIAYHFEPMTGHDLDIRRYMHKVEY
jgi:fructoselysine 6-phosphate deglycase